MQPLQRLSPRSPRGVTVGIAVQLLGIAIGIFGLGAQLSGFTYGLYTPDPTILELGVVVAVFGLALHIVGV